MVEAARQAYLSPGEWRLWYKDKAAQFGIEPEQFAELIIAQIKDREAKAAEKLKQDRLEEQRAERQRKTDVQEFREKARAEDAAAKRTKTRSKAFADIIKLPADQHDAKLEALANLSTPHLRRNRASVRRRSASAIHAARNRGATGAGH